MNHKTRIAVIGGGVNGIGASLAVLMAHPKCQLTVYADSFTPNTTGDGAAGIWGPIYIQDTSNDAINKWAQVTWNLLHSWCKSGQSGVFITPVTEVCDSAMELPHWKHIPFGFREMGPTELTEYGQKYVFGMQYSSIVAEPRIFLPRLQEELKIRGATLKRRKVPTLEELSDEADIIINCSGIGSHHLVPDEGVFPIRGQVIRVKAPWIKSAFFDMSHDSYAYIIPNTNSVVLGGTHQENDWRTTVDANDKQTIWGNCVRAIPSIQNAEVMADWVGLRPARRGGIRLERSEISCRKKKIPVIHNYGHGGSGVTLFWGCAQDTAKMVGEILYEFHGSPSKL